MALDGTRLVVAPDGKGAYDFSICSPSTPERFTQYEVEMEKSFGKLIDALVGYFHPSSSSSGSSSPGSSSSNSDENNEEKKETIIKLSLELFYYWVNFAPLTRGTSATGYASFLSFVILLDDYTLGR